MDQKTKARRFTPISNAHIDFRYEFQTPAIVAKHMVKMIPTNAKTILEPTAGIGRLVKEIAAAGYECHAPKDFFSMVPGRYDCIVMNPPFSTKWAYEVPEGFEHRGMRLGYYILTECMKMTNSVIALMPWFTISDSDLRLRSLKKWGLKSVTALPRKTFQYARIQTCILELEFGYQMDTKFYVFDHDIKPELFA